MRVTVTGATGLIGSSLVAALRERGAQVTVLTRDPARAQARLGDVEAVGWETLDEPAPAQALEERDAVVHLAGEPVALDLAQGAERFGERNLRIGPMQQEQIDLAQAQPHQAVARGALKLARSEMRRPDFRGQKHFAALDVGGIETLPDFALVVVDFRGVDVAIAEPQGLFDHSRTGAAAQFPGAEPDEWKLGAVGVDAGDRCN